LLPYTFQGPKASDTSVASAPPCWHQMPTYTSVKTGRLLQKFIHVRGRPMNKQMYGQAGRWANTHTPACTCSMVISQGYVFPLEEEKEARIHSLCNTLNPHKPACSQSCFWLKSCTFTVPLTIPCQYHNLKTPLSWAAVGNYTSVPVKS